MNGELHTVVLRDGLEVRYGEAGSGRPLVLIHGFTGSRGAWGPGVVEALCGVGRVCSLDLLGHGDSEKPLDPARYRMKETIQDVAELIDAIGAGPAALVGYSMGARVSLAVAVERPDRVESLVLESGSPGLRDPEDRARRRAADRSLAALLLDGGLDPFLEHWRGLEIFRTLAERARPELIAEVEAQRGSNDPRALAAALEGLGTGSQPQYWTRLDAVRCPTLILTGSLDPKFTRIGREMALGIPDAVHEVVEECGHRVHLEHPDRWARVVSEFLGMAGT